MVSDDNGASPAGASRTRNFVQLGVSMPQGMKDILEGVAKEQNKTISAWARDTLAHTVGYDVPSITRARAPKYATQAERDLAKVATQERAKSKREQAAMLFRAMEAGLIDFDKIRETLASQPATPVTA